MQPSKISLVKLQLNSYRVELMRIWLNPRLNLDSGVGGFNPQENSNPPRKNPNPPRSRGYSHEKEVLGVSQSINSTDFLQQQKSGLCPKLIIKLSIRFLNYVSNYCTSTQLYLNNGFMMQVDHGSFRSAI